jgi:hypothetical protein
MLNLVEKFYAVLVSDRVRVWDFHCRRPEDGPRFALWPIAEDGTHGEPHEFSTLERLVEEAYALIDPLRMEARPPAPPEGVTR